MEPDGSTDRRAQTKKIFFLSQFQSGIPYPSKQNDCHPEKILISPVSTKLYMLKRNSFIQRIETQKKKENCIHTLICKQSIVLY